MIDRVGDLFAYNADEDLSWQNTQMQQPKQNYNDKTMDIVKNVYYFGVFIYYLIIVNILMHRIIVTDKVEKAMFSVRTTLKSL